jgi:hypothetical protein
VIVEGCLFTVYLPPGRVVTIFVVTSVAEANAQNKKENRMMIRDDKSLYRNERKSILQRMLMRKDEKGGGNKEDVFIRDKEGVIQVTRLLAERIHCIF